MHFDTKSYLKSTRNHTTRNHTAKHALNSCCRKDPRGFYESPRIARVHWVAQGNEAK
jgi:hypothetical protein